MAPVRALWPISMYLWCGAMEPGGQEVSKTLQKGSKMGPKWVQNGSILGPRGSGITRWGQILGPEDPIVVIRPCYAGYWPVKACIRGHIGRCQMGYFRGIQGESMYSGV